MPLTGVLMSFDVLLCVYAAIRLTFGLQTEKTSISRSALFTQALGSLTISSGLEKSKEVCFRAGSEMSARGRKRFREKLRTTPMGGSSI